MVQLVQMVYGLMISAVVPTEQPISVTLLGTSHLATVGSTAAAACGWTGWKVVRLRIKRRGRRGRRRRSLDSNYRDLKRFIWFLLSV